MTHQLPSLVLGELGVVLDTTDAVIHETLGRAFASLVRDGGNADEIIGVDLDADGKWAVVADGFATITFAHRSDAVDKVVSIINGIALDVAHTRLNIHAGGVARSDDHALLLAGVPGAGKSTLTAALLSHGYRYLTDEMIGLSADSRRIAGYQKALTLKRGSETVFTGIDFAEYCSQKDGQLRWYVPATHLGAGAVIGSALPHTLVFPKRIDIDRVDIERLSRPHALLRLLLNSFDLERFGSQALEVAANFVASCHLYVVAYADANEAANRLSKELEVDPVDAAEVSMLEPHSYLGGESTDDQPIGRPTVHGVSFEDGGVLHDTVSGRLVALDPPAVATWCELDGTRTLAEIAASLARRFDANQDIIERDVATACAQLAAGGFLAGVDATQQAANWREAQQA